MVINIKMTEDEYNRHQKKRTRREVLKIGANATLYSGIGAIFGKLFGVARDKYEEFMDMIGEVEEKAARANEEINRRYDKRTEEMKKSSNPAARAGGEVADKVEDAEDWRTDLFRKILIRDEEDVEEYREERGLNNGGENSERVDSVEDSYRLKEGSGNAGEKEEVTRRGFFGELLSGLGSIAYDHPTETGAILGAAYGATKSGLSSLIEGRTPREIARLKDENERLDDKAERLGEMVEGLNEKVRIGEKIGDSYGDEERGEV